MSQLIRISQDLIPWYFELLLFIVRLNLLGPMGTRDEAFALSSTIGSPLGTTDDGRDAYWLETLPISMDTPQYAPQIHRSQNRTRSPILGVARAVLVIPDITQQADDCEGTLVICRWCVGTKPHHVPWPARYRFGLSPGFVPYPQSHVLTEL